MRNTRKSGQISRSKKRPRPTLRSGRGSRTNSNTSHQIPARVIEADSARAAWVAGPKIDPTDPTGRSSGRCITCTPCRGEIPPLTREQAELFHAPAPDWQLTEEAHRIERSFRFRNFRQALTFVQEIGELAEAEGPSSEYQLRLGQCDGLSADQEDQGTARERLHHGHQD